MPAARPRAPARRLSPALTCNGAIVSNRNVMKRFFFMLAVLLGGDCPAAGLRVSMRRSGRALPRKVRYRKGMCGRIMRTSPAEVLAAEFGATPPAEADLRPRWNLCPGEDLLLVVQRGEERRMATVRWGFLPWFARDANDGPRSINARSESVATRPAFRDAFRRHRCLVAADGFYEWRREGRSRQPFFIRPRSRRPMAL